MNRIAISIKNRLSLRLPQAESLGIMADLADRLALKKPIPSLEGTAPTPTPSSEGKEKGWVNSQDGNFLAAELEKVKSLYPTCTDFERNFPSLCFALATGVGRRD